MTFEVWKHMQKCVCMCVQTHTGRYEAALHWCVLCNGFLGNIMGEDWKRIR